MCFGSAFIASNSSASFKVRKVYLTQHPEQPITIRISPVNASKAESQNELEEIVSSDADAQPEETAGITYDRTIQLYKSHDYLGQRKGLSLTYDTNMKIEVFSGADTEGMPIATFTVSGIDEISASDLLKKEGVTKPKVSLSFELTRSGII